MVNSKKLRNKNVIKQTLLLLIQSYKTCFIYIIESRGLLIRGKCIFKIAIAVTITKQGKITKIGLTKM